MVSLLTDLSSEMIYPLLPFFLTTTLGVSASVLGAIEGAAESTSSLLKLASGWWSDRVKRRVPLILFGYGLATLVRPLVAVAQAASQVLAIRLIDRVGKGIRGAPRDALIADSVDPSIRGRAFGFQRGADHFGGFVGPLVAFAILTWSTMELRSVFWLAAIPGVLSVVVLAVFVRDRAPREAPTPVKLVVGDAKQLPRVFWGYLAVVLLFTLGNSTDAFLLLRANQLGVPIALAPILWALLHAVKSLASTPGGALSDRFGRVPAMIAGWTVFALVYFGFAVATEQWHAWGLFVAYAFFFALTEGAERALVADLVPAARRGAAYGWFHLTIGLGALPASLLFGIVWDRVGSSGAFVMGASVAALASVSLLMLRGLTGGSAGLKHSAT